MSLIGHMAAKFGVFVNEDHIMLRTLYWLPKLQKRSYQSRLLLMYMYDYLVIHNFYFLPHD